MFSSSRRSKRKRGVILSSEGWQRLESAKKAREIETNRGIAYTLEDLNELTGLSSHTLTKVRRRQKPVDRQTLEDYFNAFDLKLTASDYTKPIALLKTQLKSVDSDEEDSTLKSQILQQERKREPSLPEGQVPLDSPFYIMRSPVEENCYQTILQPGSLIRIKAPRRMGKSSLMVRILNHAAQQGCQTVFLSLQLADRSILQDLDKFLQWFSASVGLGMRMPNRLDDYWDLLFGSKISCKIYFEEYLLANAAQPLVLALDDVDRLFDYPELADEFFGLLRTWHEQAKNNGIWQQLKLIVAHSTEVYIPLNTNKSPFNVGLPIELQSLNVEQIQSLAERYDLSWSKQDAQQMMGLVCGHPYLIQLGLYALWKDKISWQQLLQQADEGIGIYANHLQRILWTLEKDSALANAYFQVLRASEPVELELIEGFKLESLGLVNLQGNKATSSCDLYTKYFSDRLNNRPLIINSQSIRSAQ